MKKYWSAFILCLFFLTVFNACKTQVQPPENLIDEDTYINLMIEFQLLESYRDSMPPDSVATDSLKEVVLEKYSVTEAQFLTSREYYRQDYEQHVKRIEKAIEELRIDQVQEDSTAANDSANKDQAEVQN